MCVCVCVCVYIYLPLPFARGGYLLLLAFVLHLCVNDNVSFFPFFWSFLFLLSC